MKKILVVDDQSDVINIIMTFLRGIYEVYPARTTMRALSLLRMGRFDLILLDILLPGMNGIDFFKHARSQIWYEKTPVIFMSSESDIKTVASVINLGAEGFIKKPIEKNTLLQKIAAVERYSKLKMEIPVNII
jgi:DNA-binding response OmpR family regulator